jgi:DNA polymerase III epsilon subunit-like protein
MDLIFLDTESTGNDLTKDRICQVCYQTKEGIYNGYFKPPIPMSVKSMSVTHITEKMLADKESFETSQTKQDLDRLLKERIMVAHNARFDMAMLALEGLSVPRYICTLRVARALDVEGKIPEYNLQFLRYYLDLEIEGTAHDAEGDVKVLVAIFDRLLKKVMQEIPDREKALEKMMDISKNPSLYKVFNFGKHKDRLIKEVAETDKGYLEWLLNQKIAAPDEDEDWIYTLKYYLGK